MEYRKLVTEGRGLVSRAKDTRDRLIALTLEAIDIHQVTQREWANDIGVHEMTISRWYRFGHDQLSDGARTYQEWREQEETGASYSDLVERGTRNLPAEQKAEVVRQWLADDDGGRTRAEVGRVLHQHDTDIEQHITDVRQARTSEGERPDFEATESVQRVLAAYAELGVASDRLPATLADRSKSLIAYAAARALPTVQYHAGFEHEHGLTDAELEKWFS